MKYFSYFWKRVKFALLIAETLSLRCYNERTKKRITRKDKNMTEYEMKALRITELAREYSRLHNVPDVDEKRTKIEQEINQLKQELKEAHENGKC